jgi:hypothetical protein
MTEEILIDKVTLKKRWGIDETKLSEIISQGILRPYKKRTDGTFARVGPVDYANLTMKVVDEQDVFKDAPPTKEQAALGLRDFVWFSKIEIEDAEYEGKIKLPDKAKEEMLTPLQTDTKEADSFNISEYIQKRRREGVNDGEIATELHDKLNFTYVQIGRGLGLDRNYQDNQHAALKQCVIRLIAKNNRRCQKS